MVKRLAKMGNSFGIVIDKPILELLNISPETPLSVTTDGTGLIIRPMRVGKDAMDATKRVMAKHDAVLKKLAK
jgi:antitoxin MazE